MPIKDRRVPTLPRQLGTLRNRLKLTKKPNRKMLVNKYFNNCNGNSLNEDNISDYSDWDESGGRAPSCTKSAHNRCSDGRCDRILNDICS